MTRRKRSAIALIGIAVTGAALFGWVYLRSTQTQAPPCARVVFAGTGSFFGSPWQEIIVINASSSTCSLPPPSLYAGGSGAPMPIERQFGSGGSQDALALAAHKPAAVAFVLKPATCSDPVDYSDLILDFGGGAKVRDSTIIGSYCRGDRVVIWPPVPAVQCLNLTYAWTTPDGVLRGCSA